MQSFGSKALTASHSPQRTSAFRALLIVALSAVLPACSCSAPILGISDASPREGSTKLPRTQKLQVIFDREVDGSSINANTFQVEGVQGAVTFEPADRRATFQPLEPYPPGMRVVGRLTTDIRGVDGARLKEDFTWSFTVTDDAVGPRVVSISPEPDAVDVPRDTVVRITFDEEVVPATVNSSTIVLVGVPASVTYVGNRVALLTPLAPLANVTRYVVTVTGGIADETGNGLSEAFTSAFTTEEDRDPPKLISRWPEPDGTPPPNTPVFATFDEPLDPASITSEKLTLEDASGVQVSGSLSYEAGSRSVVFRPFSPLNLDERYSATLAEGLRDVVGNVSAEVSTWSFRPATDSTPPTVVSTVPENNATNVSAQLGTVRVTFSEPMDPNSIHASSIRVTNANGSSIGGSVAYLVGTRTATLTVPGELAPEMTYSGTVSTTARDLAGNSLAAPHTWQFTVPKDTTPPAVISYGPTAADRFLGTAPPITATFNERLDISTVTATNFTIVGVAGSVTYDSTNHLVTFVPDAPLQLGQSYTVRVMDVADARGNKMTSPFVWTFTTVPKSTVVSGETLAVVSGGAVAYLSSGAGMAVWRVQDGASSYPVFSRYVLATGTWTTEARIPTLDYTTAAPQVLAVGNSFVVSTEYTASSFDGTNWTTTVFATQLVDIGGALVNVTGSWGNFTVEVFDGTTWSASTVLSDTSIFDNYRIVGLGGGKALASYHSNGQLYVRTYEDGVWSEPSTVTAATGDDAGVPVYSAQHRLSGAGNRQAALVFETSSAGERTIWATAFSGVAWDEPQALVTLASSSLFGTVRVASSWSQHLVLWGSASVGVPLRYSSYSAGSWSAPADYPNGNPSAVFVRALAASDSGAIGLQLVNVSGGQDQLVAFSGNAFGAETPLRESPGATPVTAVLLGGQSTLIAAFVLDGSLYERRWAAGTWSAMTSLESGTDEVRSHTVSRKSSDLTVTWNQGSSIFHRLPGASAGTKLEKTTWRGGVVNPQLVTGAAGHAVASWLQFDRGNWHLYASAFDGVAWSAPQKLADTAVPPALASNGDSVVVAYAQGPAVYAVPVTGTSFGGAQRINGPDAGTASVNELAIASDGQGYASVWRAGTLHTSESSDGTTWAPFTSLPLSSNRERLALASDGDRYALAHQVTGAGAGNRSMAVRIWSEGVWSADQTMASVADFKLAAIPGTFGLLWGIGWSGCCATFRTEAGAGWSSQMSISVDNTHDVLLTPDGPSGFAAYVSGNQRFVRYRNGAWETPVRPNSSGSVEALATAANGGSYVLVQRVGRTVDGNYRDGLEVSHSVGGVFWRHSGPIHDGTQSVEAHVVQSRGARFDVLFTQQADDGSATRLHALMGL